MGAGDRTVQGSAVRIAAKKGAPRPGREVDRDAMSTGIRELVQGWGGAPEPGHDDERLAAIRQGARFARPVLPDALPEAHDDR